MNRHIQKATGLKLAYIGGGSRGWAWGLLADLAREGQMSGSISLYDIDHDAALQNVEIGKKMFSLEQAAGKWNLQASTSLQHALQEADFVILSILPATYKEMRVDVHAPEQYGIYQAVGDTVGPGGLFRALRTIPMYQEIALAIKEFCPKAWVINYTNPMTICTRTLYESFPEIKAFGCCHEVFGTQELMGFMLEDMHGIKGVQRDDIRVNVLGINHFTWLDKVTYQGNDLIPLYSKFIEKYSINGYSEKNKEYIKTSYFGNTNLVKFDLFKRFGLVAAAGDRHLAEFCPGWYITTPETVASWQYKLTPVSFRESELANRNQHAKDMISGKAPVKIHPSGEEGVKQMKALLGLGDMVTNVNLRNTGQIPSLPLGAVVETNAVFSHNNIRPVYAGSLPGNINSLVYQHVINQETIVKAGFERCLKTAFMAFINDPLVHLSLHDAKALFQTMVKGTKTWLPGYSGL